MGGVGLLSGLWGIKNGMTFLKETLGKEKAGTLPPFAYGLQALLQGGLSIGALIPFINQDGKNKIKSPFIQKNGDQEVVTINRLIGAMVAPVALGLFMKMAQGRSVLNRIPIIGKPLSEITGQTAAAAKYLTTSTTGQTEEQQVPSPAAA